MRREAERQAALDRYAIVDTAPEQAFDDIVRLAATLCDMPAAAISLIDHERLWFKARIGIDQPQLDRARSLCGHAIDAPNETLVVAGSRRRIRSMRSAAACSACLRASTPACRCSAPKAMRSAC